MFASVQNNIWCYWLLLLLDDTDDPTRLNILIEYIEYIDI